jgi:hypothetical protein
MVSTMTDMEKPNAFTDSFDSFVCDEDTIKTEPDTNGVYYVATVKYDGCGEAPWEENDGHGPVSDWRRLDSKRPGERVLCTDRSSARFYDFEEAVKIARADGWDAEPYKTGTPGERAVRAVEDDFKVLKAWCNDEWSYCGVVLSQRQIVDEDDVELDKHVESLRGIEANYPGTKNEHLTQVANDLLEEAKSRTHSRRMIVEVVAT